MDGLTIHLWNDNLYLSSPAYGNRTYKLNDYIFISGICDPYERKQQKLFDYMKDHFGEFEGRKNAYQEDCVLFLDDLQKRRQEELQERCDKEKLIVELDIGEKKSLVLGEKQ